jgi:hypothetical protein
VSVRESSAQAGKFILKTGYDLTTPSAAPPIGWPNQEPGNAVILSCACQLFGQEIFQWAAAGRVALDHGIVWPFRIKRKTM